MGIAQVYVDGKIVSNFNAYASKRALGRVTKTGLRAGAHTIEVVVTGRTGKKGTVADDVAVDRLDVR